jgi:peptidoglycan/LPS O-acetylase OafA/YrhL
VDSLKLPYRAEIDGLRAVAVISVILYHAQITLFGRDWFEGGFIGVDVFFVISGYLITRIILLELQTKNTFSPLNFYERRARRILPALFLVIFASIPYAWQRLLPSDFVEYADSIIASLFFGSNFFFYFSTTEYGADSALLKPFLHTWSLGVEEQFYFIFPALAVVIYKYFRAHFLTIILVLSLLSLLFAELMEARNSELNFFLPLSRFWELGAGSVLAFKELNHKQAEGTFLQRLFPTFGLCLVAYSILFFDGETPHPSFHTIVPIFGVALIIGFASKDELVGTILSSKPFVWIGLISYSAYLWHFPIFAFSRMGKDPTNYDKFEWIVLTFVLSLASYFLIEKPFRRRAIVSSKLMWLLLLLCLICAVSCMGYVKLSKGVWDRFSLDQRVLIKGFDTAEFRSFSHPTGVMGTILDKRVESEKCYLRDPNDACRFGDEKFIFLGDSYVAQYERAVFARLKTVDMGFISLSYGQCPFVSEDIWFDGRAECPYVNEQRRKVIEGFTDSKIFLISANDQQFENTRKRTSNPVKDGWEDFRGGERASSQIAWKSYFQNIEWLVSRGHKVILVRSLPRPTLNALKWLPQNTRYISQRNFPYLPNKDKPSKILSSDNNKYPEFIGPVVVIDPVNSLCDLRKDICWDVIPNGPIYDGGRHLSFIGANLVAKDIVDALAKF